jgi:microcin C transport system substrate-binding protein
MTSRLLRPISSMALSGLLLALAAQPLAAQDEWRTVTSLIEDEVDGEPFERYDHVNPDAPKGGTLNSVVIGTFDSFNPYVLRGTPAAGLAGFGGGLLYDTLLQQSIAEPSTSYPMIAEAIKYPEDFSSVTFRLNPEARWHDGQPITADDVIWSFEVLREHSQLYNRYYANVTSAEAISEFEVEFRFDETGNRELPHIMGDLAVLPRHWWEGQDSQGRQRDVTQPTLEPPLGSGAYRIASFRPGSEIIWERVDDYWARDLAVNVGRYNFDRRRYTYFQDDNAAWQAFTKGGVQDVRFENRAQRWAIEYNFPAAERGDVVRDTFETNSGQNMQGFVLNMRKPEFQDRRVRQAITYAFDFESMNRRLFYDSYTRTRSYFEGGELASSGLPEGLELEILETVRDEIAPEIFTEEFVLPVFDTPQSTRENLRRASQLLAEAGWRTQGGRLVNEAGQQMQIEFLGRDPTDERVNGPLIENLRRLGIDATLRVVDTTQYINRVRAFEFDVVTTVQRQSLSPGNEQRDYWSTQAADMPGSRNLAGIKDPAIDKLIDRIIFAKDREELVAATRALDRVLLWGFYMIPQWHNPDIWVAYWNKFGIPEEQPLYTGVDLESWWIIPDRETAIEETIEDEVAE